MKKQRNDFVGYTPDGVRTKDVRRYVREWNAIKEPLMKHLGLQSIGFDPGFLMCDAENPERSSVDIPLWLARRILAAIEQKPAP